VRGRPVFRVVCLGLALGVRVFVWGVVPVVSVLARFSVINWATLFFLINGSAKLLPRFKKKKKRSSEKLQSVGINSFFTVCSSIPSVCVHVNDYEVDRDTKLLPLSSNEIDIFFSLCTSLPCNPQNSVHVIDNMQLFFGTYVFVTYLPVSFHTIE
jgi:hypothetical protein